MQLFRIATFVVAAGLLGGSANAGKISDADRKAAADKFQAACALCHGATGKADGPASAGFNPKPANFADPAWQKATKDEAISKIILEGGPAVGKSPAMPPNPDLKGKDGVVAALVELIRSLGPKK